MSRKTLLGVLGVFGAVLTIFKDNFGLAIDATGIIAGLSAITLYILWEAKADIKRVAAQVAKFKDPKFWIASASTLLVAIDSGFELNLPVEAIVAILTLLMGILFREEAKKA